MGCTESKEITAERIVEGLKAALQYAAEQTVKQLGSEGGFSNDPKLKIEIPGVLGKIQDNLEKLPGELGKEAKDFETKVNRAAEAACASCLRIFTDLIPQINFADARAILDGADDEATKIFRQLKEKEVLATFQPIVKAKMEEMGVIKLASQMKEFWARLPIIGETDDLDIYEYVATKADQALWVTMAQWETKVRNSVQMQRTNKAMEDAFGARKNQQK